MKIKKLFFGAITVLALTACQNQTSTGNFNNPSIFINSRYQYQLTLAPDEKVVSQCAVDKPAECPNITVVDPDNQILLGLKVTESNTDDESSNLPIDQYAEKIWEINKNNQTEDKIVSDLNPIVLGNQPGQEFTATKSYQDETGQGFALENGTWIINFTQFDNKKYLLWFPLDCPACRNLVDSLTFGAE